MEALQKCRQCALLQCQACFGGGGANRRNRVPIAGPISISGYLSRLIHNWSQTYEYTYAGPLRNFGQRHSPKTLSEYWTKSLVLRPVFVDPDNSHLQFDP